MDRWGPQQSNGAPGAPAVQRGLCLQKSPVGGGDEVEGRVGSVVGGGGLGLPLH